MDREMIKKALLATLEEIQVNSGRRIPEIDEHTHPIGDLPGFDSINAVEASTLLSEHLGVEVEPDMALFTRFGRAQTVFEIIDRLTEIINK